jgi:hypothetical protein
MIVDCNCLFIARCSSLGTLRCIYLSIYLCQLGNCQAPLSLPRTIPTRALHSSTVPSSVVIGIVVGQAQTVLTGCIVPTRRIPVQHRLCSVLIRVLLGFLLLFTLAPILYVLMTPVFRRSKSSSASRTSFHRGCMLYEVRSRGEGGVQCSTSLCQDAPSV